MANECFLYCSKHYTCIVAILASYEVGAVLNEMVAPTHIVVWALLPLCEQQQDPTKAEEWGPHER